MFGRNPRTACRPAGISGSKDHWYRLQALTQDPTSGRLTSFDLRPWEADINSLLSGVTMVKELTAKTSALQESLEHTANDALVEWKTRTLPGLLKTQDTPALEDLVIRTERGYWIWIWRFAACGSGWTTSLVQRLHSRHKPACPERTKRLRQRQRQHPPRTAKCWRIFSISGRPSFRQFSVLQSRFWPKSGGKHAPTLRSCFRFSIINSRYASRSTKRPGAVGIHDRPKSATVQEFQQYVSALRDTNSPAAGYRNIDRHVGKLIDPGLPVQPGTRSRRSRPGRGDAAGGDPARAAGVASLGCQLSIT